MKVYIAASWKHQHAVEMLTDLLRARGHNVLSFVENQHGEQASHVALLDGAPLPFDQWVWSERGSRSFEYDTKSAASADLVVYIGPSGMDAAAEVGMAWSQDIPIYGLWAKGGQLGLMRRLITEWFTDHRTLLTAVATLAGATPAQAEGSAA